jgi:threonine/homoserine/homoserine lactone efflux protein
MTETQLLLFIATSLLIIITPGQDLVLVLSRGISHGARAGIATAGGVSLGLIGHTLFATFGLGAVLMASNIVFVSIKVVGAVYLVYLGYKLITSKSHLPQTGSEHSISLWKCFSSGAFSNISNPKITIFYFAYLPQFISSSQHTHIDLLFLGTVFACITFIVKGPIGYFAGKLSKWILNNGAFLKWLNRTSGVVLVLLGVKLAFEKK